MKNRIAILILNALFIYQSFSSACDANAPSEANDILLKLNQSVKNIEKLSAKIEYTHAQPLFETQTVRSGRLFYVKDANNSILRINFLTIKQDDSFQQNYREDYIFDGTKLTKIDYQSKSAISEQLAKDKPIEPFELVQSYFPIIGFARPDELSEQFEIAVLKNPEQKKTVPALRLIPKENSGFFKIYRQIDFKINPAKFLPAEFSAETCDNEKITITLTELNITATIDRIVFDLNIPAGFAQVQK